mmetsp:Transcript_60779/g.98393  ORF Transcript_60779/g.98393 Transcript_60779/m.98393 type:complete len:216 (-) Transcript_60779:892-1539(-)
MLAHTREVNLAGVAGECLEGPRERIELLAVFVGGIQLVGAQEGATHRHQCGLRPRHEPVDVDSEDCWELLRTNRELRVHRREAEADMQVVPKPIHQVVVHVEEVLLGVRVLLDKVIANIAAHAVSFVLGKESHDLTSGKQRVHVLQEIFAFDLRIGENESHALILGPSSDAEIFQVLKEGVVVVGLGDGDLEGIVPGSVGGQSGQGLLATATYAD